MENKKYYTPIKEEFHIGFEYEIHSMATSPSDKRERGRNIWHKEIFGDNFISLVGSDKNLNAWTRVKHLDLQDCKELGWDTKGSGWFNLKEVPGSLGHFLHVRMRLFGDRSFIKAYRYDPEQSQPEHDEEYLFQGTIRNKSELKKIMQLINIK